MLSNVLKACLRTNPDVGYCQVCRGGGGGGGGGGGDVGCGGWWRLLL